MGPLFGIGLGIVLFGLGRWLNTHEFWSVAESRERARRNPESSFWRENYRMDEYIGTRVLPTSCIVLGLVLIGWGLVDLVP